MSDKRKPLKKKKDHEKAPVPVAVTAVKATDDKKQPVAQRAA